MSEIKIKEITDKSLWEKFLSESPQCSFLQSWDWGETHRLLDHKVFYFGFYCQEKLKGVVLLIKQQAKRGSYLECPGGPIINWDNLEFFDSFVDLIREVAGREKCVFARVRPQILADKVNWDLFKNKGFLKAPMHLHAQDTWVLDISKDEKTLLNEMRKTTRYLITKACREGVRVVQSSSISDIKILFDLQKETAQRHDFVPFPLSFFEAHFKAFAVNDQVKIFKALWQGKVLSIAMIVFYVGRAVYHYSASSDLHSKVPASYLIQWEVIKEAKKRNCQLYDFWGIAPEGSSPTHRFAGVTLFKKGFGGYRVSYLPAHDLPLRLDYQLVRIFETGRRVVRRLN